MGMKDLIIEIMDLVEDLRIARASGDMLDAWATKNMIEARADHLRDIITGRE